MRIAIFGKDYKVEQRQYLQLLIDELSVHEVSFIFFKPFLDKIAATHTEVILSTGLSTLEEVSLAVQTIRKHHNQLPSL